MAKLPGLCLSPEFLGRRCRIFLENAQVRLMQDQSPSSG
jgi:hypothetical protein